MSEYINVEKPFLNKLEALGWEVIDHELFGIPQDPAVSLRNSFREVTLKDIFKKSISYINADTGAEWLTDRQLEFLYSEITAEESSHKALLEANKSVFRKLIGKEKTVIDKNEQTGEENIPIKFVDFKNWERNSFIAINQFRVDTPGGPRQSIIPDIVLFVNGLPFIVIECKDVDVSEPLSEAVNQIARYANTRDDQFGIKEGEEKLFHYNLFSIATHGEEARFASISGDFEYYLNWKDIFPVDYKVFDITQYSPEETIRYSFNGLVKEPQVRQEVMIHGMLNKEILVDVLKHFTLFMEKKEGKEIKIICRYQQYRAVGNIIKQLRIGTTPNEKSGVVWHTQGSGKSLTMVFLVRKIRSQEDLKDYKIIMVNDRSDLEYQLSKTAKLTDEFKNDYIINHRRELKPKLSDNASNLSMVMIHKFLQEENHISEVLVNALYNEGKIPKFKPFEVVNRSDRILLLIDEAHRTQGGDMGDNLFTAFPNAAKIAFTGTPLLTDRHKQKTHERFGSRGKFIDTYKIRESVRDRATLDIIYIGKTSNDKITDNDAFDREFEDVFIKQSRKEKEEIQRRYGTMEAYLEFPQRMQNIARDIANHYIDEIFPNGYKAMVVASSIAAAAKYEYYILEALKQRLEYEESKAERDEDLIHKMKIINACTVVTKQDNNELGFISMARKKTKEKRAVDNFKKDFDFTTDKSGNFQKPETGISFICVCDRLLTGFDVPVAQVMYLDKNIREHDLLQAIARVNRTKGTKQHGILVDYFGVSNHLREALNIWGAEDEDDIKELLEYFRDINKEIPVLEARYNRMLQLFEDNGIKEIRDFVTQQIEDDDTEFRIAESCIDLASEVRFRAQFDTYLQSFFDSLDLLFNTSQGKIYYIPAKRFGYLLMRIRNRYKDATMDLKWAKPKVRKMIDKYLESMGINSKIPPVSLLSDEFKNEVNKFSRNSKSKASEMEHAIRRHIKINMQKDPGLYTQFNVRLKQIMQKYKDNWDIIAKELSKLREDMVKGIRPNPESGLSEQEIPFFDLILMIAYPNSEPIQAEKENIKEITKSVVVLLKDALSVPQFWKNRETEIRQLLGKIDDIFDFSSVQVLTDVHKKLSNEIMALAKKRHNELTGEE